MVFEAGVHGINLNEEGKKGKSQESSSEVFEFKSPEEYENMSMEDRKKLTEKMMGQHKLKFG
jgi:hypothetical protein